MLSIGSHDLAIRRAERLCVDNVWQEIGEAYNRGFKHSSQDSLTRFRKDGRLSATHSISSSFLRIVP